MEIRMAENKVAIVAVGGNSLIMDKQHEDVHFPSSRRR